MAERSAIIYMEYFTAFPAAYVFDESGGERFPCFGGDPMENHTLCIPCLFGLEGLVGEEMRRLDMEDVQVVDRRVYFSGGADAIARANLNCRMGERVMLRLAEFEVHSFEDLFQGVKSAPLEQWIPADGAFPVKGYSLSSQLHSVPDCQSIVKKAAADRLGEYYGLDWLPETGSVFQLRFSIMKDVCELFLDTSGLSLHKRGYRAVSNEAPLHETMAAAMVTLARYRGREYLWDPFCGSGTIVIEAALIALNRAPGLGRSFAAQNWPSVPQEVWARAKEEARDREFHGNYRILGTDSDPHTLGIAISNAKKAGVGKLIEFREADATRMSPPTNRGVIVTNPPYGERMMERKSAQKLYRTLGKHWRFTDGWDKYILSSEPEFEYYYGARAAKKRKLYNGRLQCNVYMYLPNRK